MHSKEILVAVSIDAVCCSGCEACVELVPEVFGFDPVAGVAVIKTSACILAQAEEAAAYCPEDCIEWEACDAWKKKDATTDPE